MADQMKTTVHEFPAGRLASFEDDFDVPDLTTILKPRIRTATTANEQNSQAATGGVVVTVEPTKPAAPTTPKTKTPQRPKPPKSTNDSPTPTPSPQETEPEDQNGTASASPARRVIRPSSVHIPADLIDKLKHLRDTKKWSNGQVIVAALESCADTLADLISPSEVAGGGLFAARPARGVRTVDGPLTALNIRLYDQDYEVIDSLVEKYGAFSRGHLISVALTHYLID
jgi:hypothetical protein